jgi:hypothetical protein
MKPAVFDPNPARITIVCPHCKGRGTKEHRRLLYRLYRAPLTCAVCKGERLLRVTVEEAGRLWPGYEEVKEEEEQL